MLRDLNKEDKQEYLDPIEIWFQLVIKSHHSFYFSFFLDLIIKVVGPSYSCMH
jgi:hypothetical protein